MVCLRVACGVAGSGGEGTAQLSSSFHFNFFTFFFLAVPRGLWDLNFPNQGWNPRPLQWKHRVLTTVLPHKSPGIWKTVTVCSSSL